MRINQCAFAYSRHAWMGLGGLEEHMRGENEWREMAIAIVSQRSVNRQVQSISVLKTRWRTPET
jgi:hypothetical protein